MFMATAHWVCKLCLACVIACNLFAQCERVISLAPSITDIFSKLGATNLLVGTSGFESNSFNTKKLGGFLNLDLEGLIKLKPSIVFLTPDYFDYYSFLEKFKINYKILNFSSIKKTIAAFEEISDVCKLQKVNLDLPKVTQSNKKILFVLADSKLKSPDSVYVLGDDGVFNEIIKLAGYLPAYAGQTRSIESIGFEALIAMKPDYIIEISENILDANLYQPLMKELPHLKNSLIWLNFTSATSPSYYPEIVKEIVKKLND